MAEYINNALQTIAVNENVLFTDTVIESCPCVRHREGSGIFTLRGGHTYTLLFSANIGSETAGTEVEVAFAIAGEEIAGTRMASTPTVANDINNVASFVTVIVPCGCCYTMSVENVGEAEVIVANANLIIRRED